MKKLLALVYLLCPVIAVGAHGGPTTDPLYYDFNRPVSMRATPHEWTFVFEDASGVRIAWQRVEVRVMRKLSSPGFSLLVDGSTRSEVDRYAAFATIRFDGDLVERVPYSELIARASKLAAADEFARRVINSASRTAPMTAMSKLRTATDSWEGCPVADGDWCWQQYEQCSAVCDPWDPYAGCQVCRDRLDACTGGSYVTHWVSETRVGDVFTGALVCDRPNRTATWAEHFVTTHVVEGDMWYCEASGYYSLVTDERYDQKYCYDKLADYCTSPGNDGATIECIY